MDFEFSEEQKAWRQEVIDFIAANITEELKEDTWYLELRGRGPAYQEWLRKLSAKGWLGLSWPKEYGGAGRSAVDEWILYDECYYAGLFKTHAALTMMGPTVIRVASEEMKKEWLPRILSGEIDFALAYSEPDAGTDLANLQTRAVLDGDEFVINGTKLWNSAAHYADFNWVAVRTDPNAPKHRGISILIVPMDAPGVTLSPIYVWANRRTNQTFFDNVRVPIKNLVGELNKGWQYLTTALNFERITIIPNGDLRRALDQLIDYVKQTKRDGRPLAKDPVIRNQIASLAVALQVARFIALRACWVVDQGRMPTYEASMLKVFNSEMRRDLSDVGMQILGLYGQLKTGSKWQPLAGEVELQYRNTPLLRFAGGTNEVQRDLIARHGLGMGH